MKKIIIILLLCVMLVGCTDTSSNENAGTTQTKKTITSDMLENVRNEETTFEALSEITTTTETPVDEKTKIKRKVYAYVTEYMDTTVDDVTVNEDFGTEIEDDYIVLVYLTWDMKNDGEMSKKMLDLYSSDMAARMYDDLPAVQELCIFWTVPYLNDGQAKISFERKSSGMVYTDTVFDYNFD